MYWVLFVQISYFILEFLKKTNFFPWPLKFNEKNSENTRMVIAIMLIHKYWKQKTVENVSQTEVHKLFLSPKSPHRIVFEGWNLKYKYINIMRYMMFYWVWKKCARPACIDEAMTNNILNNVTIYLLLMIHILNS